MEKLQTIHAAALHARLADGEAIDLIDVRTPMEYKAERAAAAQLHPLDELDPHAVMAGRGEKDRPVYVICKSGGRAKQACGKFHEAGYEDVVCVIDGTDGWVAAGGPVVRERSVMSLERQVRIAAGTFILIGVVLAWLVHPWLIGISAFVGAGLIFAGVTDTCGMGLLLARMPWNRVDRSTTPAPEPGTQAA